MKRRFTLFLPALLVALSLGYLSPARADLTEWLNGTVQTPATAAAPLPVQHNGYNGSAYEPWRGNVEGTALASATRTASATSADLTNHNSRGVIAYLNVTAASGTGGLSLRFQARDPVSGGYVNLNAAPTAITATGLTVYQFYPGATAGGTQVSSGVIPRTFRIAVNAGDASPYAYSAGYSLQN